MQRPAIFGPPQKDIVEGGAYLTTHLVPVFQGRLVVFDISARAVSGRWLPWTTIEFGGSPYEMASELVNEWCGGAMSDLRLVDVMSFTLGRTAWELAIIFRAELTARPVGDGERAPRTLPQGVFEPASPFEPADLERWVRNSAPQPLSEPEQASANDDPEGERLVF